jgi:hypothetical protein
MLVGRPNFPAIRYIELIDFQPTFTLDLNLYEKWKLYQLHAFLLIIDSRLNQLPPTLTKRIVAIIRYFINGLITTTNNTYLIVHDDDEQDNQSMDVDSGRTVGEIDLFDDDDEIVLFE